MPGAGQQPWEARGRVPAQPWLRRARVVHVSYQFSGGADVRHWRLSSLVREAGRIKRVRVRVMSVRASFAPASFSCTASPGVELRGLGDRLFGGVTATGV